MTKLLYVLLYTDCVLIAASAGCWLYVGGCHVYYKSWRHRG